MNVTALMNQQTTKISNKQLTSTEEKQSVFGGLLQTLEDKMNVSLVDSQSSSIREKIAVEESLDKKLSTLLAEHQVNFEQLMEDLQLKLSESEYLNDQDLEEVMSILTEYSSDNFSVEDQELMTAVLSEYLTVNQDQDDTIKDSTSQSLSLENLFQFESINSHENKALSNDLTNKLSSLWSQVEEIISKNISSGELNVTSSKILKLLEQWNGMDKFAPQETANLLMQKKETVEGQLWSRLLDTYQKRTDVQMQSKYQSNAMVTTADVSKWIKNAITKLSADTDNVKKFSLGENHVGGQIISKLEQFVVHMNQSATSNQKTMENQLMEEFQKVIKSSKFMAGPNGSNELLLKLKPNQLGDISVRLTQLNGEMIVKITATTQAAKEALESNLQQLRHMFSPQQVVIEKQDHLTFAQLQEEWNESFDDQMSQSSKQENGQDHDQDDTDQEKQELSFEQVLMNERV